MSALLDPLPQSYLISQELDNLYSSLTLYCDDIIGTVPSLRQFAAAAVSQTLLRGQILKDYLTREYPVRKRMQRST